MVLTAADLLRFGLMMFLVVLAYGRLANLLRYLFPGQVHHRERKDELPPEGPVAEGLEVQGFRYLGTREEAVFRLHRRLAAVYAHEDGRVVDLPLSGRLHDAYVMTFYEGGRCALTRSGTGRDVIEDRYRSRAIGAGKTLRDLLETHTESQAAVSLGDPPMPVRRLTDRLEVGRRWYAEHARTELLLPAALDGLLLLAFAAFGVYLWTL
ncbi:MAG: hypothetical protein ABI333_25505 [bacterium]